MTEIDKNVLREVEDNRKVEVVVKRDSADTATELDLVQVFVNMKKKRRIYAWVIIFCMLVGFAAPLLMAQLAETKEDVSAMITFLYPEALEDMAPDETPLNVNYITSSYILKNAIGKTRLSKDIPLSAIERNISIERLLSETTRQNLEVAEKVITETQKDYEQVKTIKYDYDGKYIITLANGFASDAAGNNKTYLSGSELTALLNNIIKAYNEYFYETYMNMELPDNSMDSVSNTGLDYIERLDGIVDFLNTLSKYCTDEEKEEFFLYRSKSDGMSLSDINDCIRLVRDIDVDYLYAFVYYNSITKNKQSMITNYEYLLRDTERKLTVINGNIENNYSLISEYKNDSISISNEQGLSQISSVTTDYYNELVLSQADNYSEKADLKERIANLNDKISGFKSSVNASAEVAEVENELDALTRICNVLYDITEKHAKEIIDSESYKNSYMSYIEAQYIGTSFMSASNIKKAVIGLVVGLVVAVLIWGADGLIEEFKRGSENSNSRKREEANA